MWYGVKQKAVNIESFGPSVSAASKAKALSVRDGLLKGTVHPFTGYFINRMAHWSWQKASA